MQNMNARASSKTKLPSAALMQHLDGDEDCRHQSCDEDNSKNHKPYFRSKSHEKKAQESHGQDHARGPPIDQSRARGVHETPP